MKLIYMHRVRPLRVIIDYLSISPLFRFPSHTSLVFYLHCTQPHRIYLYDKSRSNTREKLHVPFSAIVISYQYFHIFRSLYPCRSLPPILSMYPDPTPLVADGLVVVPGRLVRYHPPQSANFECCYLSYVDRCIHSCNLGALKI